MKKNFKEYFHKTALSPHTGLQKLHLNESYKTQTTYNRGSGDKKFFFLFHSIKGSRAADPEEKIEHFLARLRVRMRVSKEIHRQRI